MSGQKKGSTSFTMHRRDAIYKNLYVDNLKGRKLAITDDISMCPVVIGENAIVDKKGLAIGCQSQTPDNPRLEIEDYCFIVNLQLTIKLTLK